ncbi:hypothetical protein ACLB2K_057985 [Fragaria x ananassa]
MEASDPNSVSFIEVGEYIWEKNKKGDSKAQPLWSTIPANVQTEDHVVAVQNPTTSSSDKEKDPLFATAKSPTQIKAQNISVVNVAHSFLDSSSMLDSRHRSGPTGHSALHHPRSTPPLDKGSYSVQLSTMENPASIGTSRLHSITQQTHKPELRP